LTVMLLMWNQNYQIEQDMLQIVLQDNIRLNVGDQKIV